VSTPWQSGTRLWMQTYSETWKQTFRLPGIRARKQSNDLVPLNDILEHTRSAELCRRFLPLGCSTICGQGLIYLTQSGQKKFVSTCSLSFSPASPSGRVLRGEVQQVQNKQSLDFSPVDLSRSEAHIELRAAAVEATANAVVITDLNGAVVWANPAFERLTGYTEGEMVGQSTRMLKSGQNPRLLYEEMWRIILEGRVWHGELINRPRTAACTTKR